MSEAHIPVLCTETVDLLATTRPAVVVDGTLGLGGHAEALLERAKKEKWPVRYIGVDQDSEVQELAKKRLGTKIEYLYGNFADLKELLKEQGITQVNAILLDIGV